MEDLCKLCELRWNNVEIENAYIEALVSAELSKKTCHGCLGLLDPLNIDENKLLNDGFELQTYKLSLSLPKHFLTIENSFQNPFKPPSDQNKTSYFPFYSLKDIWKFIMAKRLQQKLQLLYDPKSEFNIILYFQFENGPNILCHSINALNNISCDDDHNEIPKLQLSDIVFKRETIHLAGRYNKFSRCLSQTPWLTKLKEKGENSKDSHNFLHELSLEEIIKDAIKLEYNDKFGKQNKMCDSIIFSASGREDIDVRCLGTGRPFCLQFHNLRKKAKDLFSLEFLQDIEARVSSDYLTPGYDNRCITIPRHRFTLPNEGDSSDIRRHRLVAVNGLQLVETGQINRYLKMGESEKSKSYRALCYSPIAMFPELPNNSLANTTIETGICSRILIDDLNRAFHEKIEQFNKSSRVQYGLESDSHRISNCNRSYVLEINQKTPLRVLHRRTLLDRIKTIHSLQCQFLHPNYFVLELECQAGTYVKEFVHGDFGRTVPSLTSIFNRQIYLLELDVTKINIDDW